MNHTAEPAPSGAPPGYFGLPNPAPRRKPTCPFCDSLHIADSTCHCESPCGAGWCPMTVEEVTL